MAPLRLTKFYSMNLFILGAFDQTRPLSRRMTAPSMGLLSVSLLFGLTPALMNKFFPGEIVLYMSSVCYD